MEATQTATQELFNALAAFQFLRLRIEFEALSEAVLPGFAGSTLRGALGHALKNLLCARLPEVCDSCRCPEDVRDPFDED